MAEITKCAWIKSIVSGKTFADIGGLGGNAVNEMVSVALEAGASEATMVDMLPLDHPLWQDFRAACERRGVTGFQCVTADLNEPGPIGPWDVVHCSGVVYHVPDPVHSMLRLRALCRQYLVFTSMIVPRTIENASGRLELGEGRAVFVPAITGATRAICASHLESLGIRIHGVNFDEAFAWCTPEGTPNYIPWWWLLTEDYVEALLRTSGFRILLKEETWTGRAVSFLCM